MTATAAPTNTTRTVGAVVRYHGSVTHEHYATFYIQAIEGNRLIIVDRDYPAVGRMSVRPSSVTPTGELLDLCVCGHEVSRCLDYANVYRPLICGATPCPCTNHRSATRKG